MNETEELFQNVMRYVERKSRLDISFRTMWGEPCATGLSAVRIRVASDDLLEFIPVNMGCEEG